MKKIYVILMIASLGVISIQAQIHLFLEEQVVDLGDSRSSAWVFPVAHDLDLAMGDLQDYCKDRSDVKLKKEGDNILMGEKSFHSDHCHKKRRSYWKGLYYRDLLWGGTGFSTGI